MVTEGEASGEQLVALDSPVAGDQEQLTPPEPVNGVDEPARIVAEPEATAVGVGLTVAVVVATNAQVPAITVTRYSPEAAGVASGMRGFWRLEAKPLGPDQL